MVEPERQTAAPTSACTEPVIRTFCPPSPRTFAVVVHRSLTATHDMSLPGNVEAWNVPCGVLSYPVVLAPVLPQWPAEAKPCCVPLVTEKPTEQRAVPLM